MGNARNRLFLLLGALVASAAATTATPDEPELRPHVALLHPDADPQSPSTTQERIPRPPLYEDLMDIKTEEDHFRCTFKGIAIDGTLGNGEQVESLSFQGYSVHLSDPISLKTLERFLRSTCDAMEKVREQKELTIDDPSITALGGARFMFSGKKGERVGQFIATSRDLLEVDPQEEVERLKAEKRWKEAKDSVHSLRESQQKEMDSRIRIHNTRMFAVDAEIHRRIDRFHPHSYEHYQWQQYLHDFSNGWNAIRERWEGANIDQRGKLLSRFHAHLKSWEEFVDITPDCEDESVFQERYSGIVGRIAELRTTESENLQRAHTRILRGARPGEVVTEQSSPITRKNFTREYRKDGVLLKSQNYEDSALVTESVFDATGTKTGESTFTYFPTGQTQRLEEKHVEGNTSKPRRRTDFWKNGNPRAVLDHKEDTFVYHGEVSGPIYKIEHRTNPKQRLRYMVDTQGKSFGHYRDEKARNKDLTPSQYVELLAEKLDTCERLAVFFEKYMWYASDGDNQDYWQSAEETVQRLEKYDETGDLYMRGDCDDYAFLAREILRKQGKNAHVVGIPRHAICIWIEKGDNNRFHALSVDTYGFDWNGNRFEQDRDHEKMKGYAKIIDALNALMKKYRYPGLGVSEGVDFTLDPEAICIMPRPRTNDTETVTADFFLKKV